MSRLLDDTKVAGAFRAALRAVLICGTAFGIGLDAAQVAAIQVVAEAALQFAREWRSR